MAVMVLGLTTISYADGVIIQKSIKVKGFIAEMKERGLDFSGGDDSDGEIQNGGTQIKVVTYKPVTPEQLNLIRDVAFHNVRN